MAVRTRTERSSPRRGAALVGAAILGATACGSSLPAPREGVHPQNAAILSSAEYPPPAATPEVVPPRPDNAACVWLDGHWEWVRRRWRWKSGQSIVPPPQCYYAPSVMFWQEQGLQLLEAHWYPDNADQLPADKARTACAAPIPCGADGQKYVPPGGQ